MKESGINLLKDYQEPNKKVRKLAIVVLIFLAIVTVASTAMGIAKIHSNPGQVHYVQSIEMTRDKDQEDYDEDNTVCDVTYVKGNKNFVVSYTYDDYVNLKQNKMTVYEYKTDNGTLLYFDHKDVKDKEIQQTYQQKMANDSTTYFDVGISFFILFLSVWLMFTFSKFFTTYEKSWFLTIMVLATIFAVLFPEESANGVNGIIIMLLYLLDTFLNILCELLISKQSRYNFLVSVAVEIVEIAICVVLMYRFATMATTLFFWLPIDIISYINWTKHKDEQEDELTMVRKLKGYQEVLVILGIVVWTFAIGYLISGLDIATDFYNNKSLETMIIYIDACASAVGIANGLFIFFRMREQWIAWYICAFLEAVINVLSGQYVLLILKLGYFTNTTYGYIKWSKYIKTHQQNKATLF